MAFYYSNKRLGWDFDLENIISQPSLVDRYLTDEEVTILTTDNLSYPQRIALLWRTIYRVANHFMEDTEYADRWTTCLHEEVCRAPQAQFDKITKTFGYENTESMTKYISKTTNSNNPVSAAANRTHQMRRDSSRLATYWKNEVSRKEVEQVRALTEPIARQYYSNESWEINIFSHE